MNELALFSGCGGGILGAKLLGWRTVCAVELDPFRCERLAQRQNEGFLPPFPIWNGDISLFDGRPWRGIVDVVSGGFPCQDISCANPNAEGITGARSGLWKEYFRLIREVGPRFVLVENSPMLTSRASEREFSSWATPTKRDWKDTPGMSMDGTNPDGSARNRRDRLPMQVYDFWPTVLKHDTRLGYEHRNQRTKADRAKGGYSNLNDVMALWPTPTKACATGGQKTRGGKRAGEMLLGGLVQPWATVTKSMTTGADMLQAQFTSNSPERPSYQEATTAFGEIFNSSNAKTENGAPLNPDFAEWLMGWPTGWSGSPPLAMDKFQSWCQPLTSCSPNS